MSENIKRGKEDEKGESSDPNLVEQLVRGGGIAFGAMMVNRAIGFVFQILLARFLGPAGYGLFVLGTTVTGFIHPIALLGLPDGIVRYIPEYRTEDEYAKARGAVFATLGLSGGVGSLFAVLLFVFAKSLSVQVFSKPELAEPLRIFALTIPFYVLMQSSTSVAVGFKKVAYEQGIINIVFPLCKLGFVGAAFVAGYQIEGAVYGFLFAVIATSIVGILSIPRVFGEIDFRGSYDVEVKRLLRYSLPVFLSGFSYLALNQIDRVVLGIYTPASTVGIYNAASILSKQTVIAFMAILAIFNPIVSELHSKGAYDELQRVFRDVTRWILIVSLPVAVLGSFFGLELLTLFDEAFQSGLPVLVLLFAAQLLYVGIGPAGEVLQMTGYQDVVLLDTLVMLAANLVLNFALVPRFGGIGAAVATTVTVLGVEFAQVFQARSRLDIHPISSEYLIVGAVGICFIGVALGVYTLDLDLPLKIGSALLMAAAYTLIIWQFSITDGDKRTLNTLLGRA